MGCQASIEAAEEHHGVVPGPTTAPSPAGASNKVAPAPEKGSTNPAEDFGSSSPLKTAEAKMPPSPAKPAMVAPEAEKEAPESARLEAGNPGLATFPVPDGWRVVCRLSPGDARSRWGSRPRPGAGAEGSKLEARIEASELAKPLRLPMSLLPFWTDPAIGSKFAGRYEVKRALPSRPWASKGLFEVYDEQEQVRRCLEVCTLAREADVKMFVGRLQLEALDTEQRLFLRLRDVGLALPGQLGVIEDLPKASLWEEIGRIGRTDKTSLSMVLAAAACSALDGLARLHANGWILCSVSPQTLCLGLDGAWKLTGLQFARQAQELVGWSGWAGPALLPEALLDLQLTEKLDIWLLGASLAEAVMQVQFSFDEGLARPKSDADGRVQKLCKLVEFLGSLPEDLVSTHPEREALFTPEGQVLRPVTPGADSAMYEAIEPVDGAHLTPSSGLPRPKLLEKALKGVENGEELIDFLGRLLQPDPMKRPTAMEALELQFLRAAKAKLEPAPSTPETSHPSPGAGKSTFTPEKTESQKTMGSEKEKAKVQITATGGEAKDTAGSKMARKGTGFVNLNDIPGSEDEDEDEDEEEEKAPPAKAGGKDNKVQIVAEGGEAKNTAGSKPARKGTGFVNMGDLPDSDSEEEEEEVVKPAKPSKVRMDAAIPQKDEGAKSQMKVARKGTGFVNTGDIPDSDDEEEEEEKPKVAISADSKKSDGGGKKAGGPSRKGTGFVNSADLPDSDDEEEEEEEAPKKKKEVVVQGEEKDPKQPSKMNVARKGTGFVNLAEIPPSDDEDEEEEEEEAPKPAKKGGVKITDDRPAAQQQPKDKPVGRKGTGFVNTGDIPDDSEEDEEEEEEPKKPEKKAAFSSEAKLAGNAKAPAAGGAKVARKGTGFINMSELPDSDDEEEEEEEVVEVPKKKEVKKAPVQFDAAAQKGGKPKEVAGKPERKGTGFVNMNDLPDSEEEDDEEEEEPVPQKSKAGAKKGGINFSQDTKTQEPKPTAKGAAKPERKGTGFVNTADLPESDDEDEEDEAPAKKGVEFTSESKQSGQAKPKGKPGQPSRKGTGFVNSADLPDSDDEEEEEEEAPAKKGVDFSKDAKAKPADSSGNSGRKADRKGTGFVNTADIPDDSDEEDEEDEPLEKPAKKGVHIDQAAKIPEAEKKKTPAGSKPARKGTGFVNMGDLPDSDSEEEEAEDNTKKAKFDSSVKDNEGAKSTMKVARKGTGFVNAADLVGSDDEDDED